MANRSSKGLGLRARGLGPRAGALALVMGLAASAAAQQPDRARTEALARRAAERLQSLQREADRLANQERTLMA